MVTCCRVLCQRKAFLVERIEFVLKRWLNSRTPTELPLICKIASGVFLLATIQIEYFSLRNRVTITLTEGSYFNFSLGTFPRPENTALLNVPLLINTGLILSFPCHVNTMLFSVMNPFYRFNFLKEYIFVFLIGAERL